MALGRSNRAWIGTGPLTPFFAFPSGVFEGKDGERVEKESERLGLGEERLGELEGESRKRLEEAASGFWKNETT